MALATRILTVFGYDPMIYLAWTYAWPDAPHLPGHPASFDPELVEVYTELLACGPARTVGRARRYTSTSPTVGVMVGLPQLGHLLGAMLHTAGYTRQHAATTLGVPVRTVGAHVRDGAISWADATAYQTLLGESAGALWIRAWQEVMGRPDQRWRYQYAKPSPYAHDKTIGQAVAATLRAYMGETGMTRIAIAQAARINLATLTQFANATAPIPYDMAAQLGIVMPGFLAYYEQAYQVTPVATPNT